MAAPSSDSLGIETSRPAEGVLLVVLDGEADILSSSAIGRPFESLDARSATHVVFDLAGVTFIDSSGVNALVQAVRTIEAQGGSAALASPSLEVGRVFEILGLSAIVRVEGDRATALERPPAPLPRAAEDT